MKTLKSLLLALVFCAAGAMAQSSEADKIQVAPYVAPNCGCPPAATKALDAKLRNVITAVGFGTSNTDRFILTAHVSILTEDVTPTAPPMYAYTLSIDLYIGDGLTGNLFASTQVETKGVGPTKDKAYLQALKALNPRDPSIKEFVRIGKDKIIDYYNCNGESILNHAVALANNQDYDAALAELNSIPMACTSLYSRASDLMVEFYTKQAEENNASLLAEAQAIWSAGNDRDAADRAGQILAGISPASSSYAKAQKLYSEMSTRVKQLDNREWAFEQKQYQDNIDMQKAAMKNEADIRKASIKAARDVAVAYAKNQPRRVYHIHWW